MLLGLIISCPAPCENSHSVTDLEWRTVSSTMAFTRVCGQAIIRGVAYYDRPAAFIIYYDTI